MAKEQERNLTDEKEKIINLTLSSIEKQYGKGAVMRLKGDEAAIGSVPVIPTGSISLDIALGVGGYPKGRIVEIYGHEASGKTTLALHAIAESQKRGGIAVFIDAEHALDINYAKRLGIQTDDLLVAQPDYGEQALDMMETLVKSNSIDIIAVDSVAALVPRAELEGEMGESHVGLQARLMSQALRKLAGAISRSKTCVVFINQTRMKIGVMFGNPETTTGGNALKFYATMRLEVRRASTIKMDDETVGNQIVVRVVKNKLSPPFKEARFDILFGSGINRLGELLDLGVEHGIIDKSGAWFSFGGERLGQGRDNSLKMLAENPEVLAAIEKRIFEKFNLINT